MRRSLRLVLVAELLTAAAGFAQPAGTTTGADAEVSPPPPVSPASECNPPCAASEACMANGNCRGSESPTAQPVIDVEPAGDAAPLAVRTEKRVRRLPLAGGIVILTASYAISAFVGMFANFAYTPAGYASFVPLFGPLVGQAMFSLTPNGRQGGYSGSWELATGFTLLQGAGLALMIFGIVGKMVPVSEVEWAGPSPSGPRWSLAPGTAGAPLGLSLLVAY